MTDQKSQESLEQLARGIAHDFYHVLGLIKNFSNFIARDAKDNPQVQSDVEAIHEALEQGERLAHRLGLFGRQEIETGRINLNDVVTQIRRLIRFPGIRVTTELAPDLPDVLMGIAQAEQIVMNLAINAKEAMPEGGDLHILTEARNNSRVCLTVTDNGKGMEPEVKERVFEPLFSTKPRTQGTGLGLPTVYRIVQRAGGMITIDSAPDEGTTVTIILPAA